MSNGKASPSGTWILTIWLSSIQKYGWAQTNLNRLLHQTELNFMLKEAPGLELGHSPDCEIIDVTGPSIGDGSAILGHWKFNLRYSRIYFRFVFEQRDDHSEALETRIL